MTKSKDLTSRPEKHSRRIIYYAQTHFQNDQYISLLPLLRPSTGVTHLIIAAIHINSPSSPSGHISLNDLPYDSPKHHPLWRDVSHLQRHGIPVLGMLGGAAQGSFTKLDGTPASFETHYLPLRRMIAHTGLSGLDLNVEEAMSLGGIIRLIVRLKADFGPGFLVTLAPVRTALVGQQNLSGFNHATLEKGLGAHVAWYNTQFYCGWGDAGDVRGFEELVAHGWSPEKVVVGLVTNPETCGGWVGDGRLRAALRALRERYPDMGGVMGWEYFNAVTERHPETGEPWVWAEMMNEILNGEGD